VFGHRMAIKGGVARRAASAAQQGTFLVCTTYSRAVRHLHYSPALNGGTVNFTARQLAAFLRPTLEAGASDK
jgi:hypothetical protein